MALEECEGYMAGGVFFCYTYFMEKTNKMKKVIIIGAGPGGLTAAMLLAARGFQVEVFEKNKQVGGRNRAIEKDGYTFDVGPTFLMMKFVLDEMFSLAKRKSEEYLKFKKLDPMYHLVFRDRDMYVSADFDKMKQEISRVFPGQEHGLEKFYRREKRRYDRLYPCLLKDYSYFHRFFEKEFRRSIPILSAGRSLYGILGDYFDNQDLRLSFTFQSKYLGMSPWECPGAFGLIPFVEHEFGIYHVIGGLNKISTAMQRVAEEHGAVFHLGSEVKQVLVEDRAAVGVELAGGEKIKADDVMINTDFGHAMTHLIPDGFLKKYTPARLAKKKYSCSTFMLYLGLDKKYETTHHTIYFAGDYRKNVEDIFNNLKLSDDFSYYVQNASVSDPTVAPAGGSTIYILVPTPNTAGTIDWEAEKEAMAEKVINRFAQQSPYQDIREHIRVRLLTTPRDWETKNDVYRGATFSLAHNLRQMLYFRPHNKFEELEHCFLAGGGTHPGSGLPTIYESGRISSHMICRQYGVQFIR